MAFGSWIKKIAKKVSGFFKDKVFPTIKKGADVVSSVAPTISKVGEAIGGRYGDVITKIGDNADKFSNLIKQRLVVDPDQKKFFNEMKARAQVQGGPQSMFGINGAGRFTVPLLK